MNVIELTGISFLIGKSKKTKRKKKEDRSPSEKGKKSHKKGEADQDEVCHLPPGDEDCSERRLGINY